ncbi:MAG TPA: reverse transcriptase-like protein [Candidatus Acidoferrum sp.]|nr:reverse transcriptase-like protein [Candidatus Acidoferrum sp.]
MPARPKPPRAEGAHLFADAPADSKGAVPAHRANVDGAARGNPGPAAYGVVIRDAGGETVARLKKHIGRMTNNVAEYYGLIAALDYAQSHEIRALRVESDSELMVKQMQGQYKVKSDDLRPLFERAKKMSQGFQSFRIDHVYREQNREADALANEALDEVTGAKPVSGPAAAAKKPEAKPGPRWIQARYRGGILYPLEDIELPDGTVVEIVLRLRRSQPEQK